MLETWLHDDTIRVQESAQSWQQALAICAAPLLESNTIRPEYLTAIVNEHNRLGPYYVLAPGLAMPHARPEEGALGLGLSLLKLHRGRTLWLRGERSGRSGRYAGGTRQAQPYRIDLPRWRRFFPAMRICGSCIRREPWRR
ncbi:Mannitol-specific cryptic phosphotransferase enzyme IIA component [Pluralibacter gergoviae]|nr:Mannitol-specific cryptic phosphotransferase enzyme IIA component [Pluralibacter gergoviae]